MNHYYRNQKLFFCIIFSNFCNQLQNALKKTKRLRWVWFFASYLNSIWILHMLLLILSFVQYLFWTPPVLIHKTLLCTTHIIQTYFSPMLRSKQCFAWNWNFSIWYLMRRTRKRWCSACKMSGGTNWWNGVIVWDWCFTWEGGERTWRELRGGCNPRMSGGGGKSRGSWWRRS